MPSPRSPSPRSLRSPLSSSTYNGSMEEQQRARSGPCRGGDSSDWIPPSPQVTASSVHQTGWSLWEICYIFNKSGKVKEQFSSSLELIPDKGIGSFLEA
ncbi:hypothetical protein ZWY2020_041034 [Hordeum vulgare]|nr:hypothetical protein ZWY2020_041034 [Hordeum vulgare]